MAPNTDTPKKNAQPFLQADGLVKVYPGKKSFTALDHVSFFLHQFQTLGIVGESGSGKTTIAKIVAGIIPATSGSLIYQGAPLGFERPREIRKEIQYIYQEPVAALDPKMTVLRILEEPLKLYGQTARSERQDRAAALLKEVGMEPDLLKRHPSELSGGQCQRVGIARALAGSPRIIVCDEPTSALDATIQAQILDLMERLKAEKGFSYLFITHSLGVAKAVSDRILVMQQGHVAEEGPTDQIFDAPQSDYTKELLASVPKINLPYYKLKGVS